MKIRTKVFWLVIPFICTFPALSANTLDTLRTLAEQGQADAQFQFGQRYEDGDAVEENLALAAHWYRNAARQGHIDAQRALAWLYVYGDGVDENTERAAFWFEQAAKQGNASAQYNLAWRYLDGTGVSIDKDKARDWFEAAARQNSSNAQNALGFFYHRNDDDYRSLAQAAYWYTQAANQQHTLARRNLADLINERPQLTLMDTARIRSEPRASADVVTNAVGGDVIYTLQEQGGWTAVILQDRKTFGWINSDKL